VAGERERPVKQWLRRLAYMLVVLLWLLLISFPVVAFLLATQGEIIIGEPDRSGLRLFMVQERQSQGGGLQWTRPQNGPAQAGCSQTSLRYYLWEGSDQGQNVDYCQCFDPQNGQALPENRCTLP
jgi:hypothetical protein